MDITEMMADSQTMLLEVPVGALRPDPEQDRDDWDDVEVVEHINSLAISIAHRGIDEPIKVRKVDDYYLIIDGECRYRAAKQAGLESLSVMTYDIDDAHASAISFSSQVNKLALKPIKLARALQKRLDSEDWDAARLEKETGLKKSWVSKKLSLLKLDPEIQDLATDGIVKDPVKLTKINALQLDARKAACEGLRDGTIAVESILAKKSKKKAVKSAPKPPTITLDANTARFILSRLDSALNIPKDDVELVSQWEQLIERYQHG